LIPLQVGIFQLAEPFLFECTLRERPDFVIFQDDSFQGALETFEGARTDVLYAAVRHIDSCELHAFKRRQLRQFVVIIQRKDPAAPALHTLINVTDAGNALLTLLCFFIKYAV